MIWKQGICKLGSRDRNWINIKQRQGFYSLDFRQFILHEKKKVLVHECNGNLTKHTNQMALQRDRKEK